MYCIFILQWFLIQFLTYSTDVMQIHTYSTSCNIYYTGQCRSVKELANKQISYIIVAPVQVINLLSTHCVNVLHYSYSSHTCTLPSHLYCTGMLL